MEAFQNFTNVGRKADTVRAVMSRGLAALDGIFEFFPAGAAGAETLTGGDFIHKCREKSEGRMPKAETNPKTKTPKPQFSICRKT
jgi:hypothetical protein